MLRGRIKINNWIEPLPKHTKLDYYECYAKIVLEELYPEQFVNLRIKDKPDLQSQDNYCGVEVTIAIDRNELQSEKLYSDITYNRVRDKVKALKRIEECGYKVENGILHGKTSTTSFDLIIASFDSKLNKLNGKGYKYFNKNFLFVFSYIYASDEMIKDAIIYMQNKQLDKQRQFNKVFVLVPGYLYCLNLYEGNYEVKRIEFIHQSSQADRARELVEAYEKNYRY